MRFKSVLKTDFVVKALSPFFTLLLLFLPALASGQPLQVEYDFIEVDDLGNLNLVPVKKNISDDLELMFELCPKAAYFSNVRVVRALGMDFDQKIELTKIRSEIARVLLLAKKDDLQSDEMRARLAKLEEKFADVLNPAQLKILTAQQNCLLVQKYGIIGGLVSGKIATDLELSKTQIQNLNNKKEEIRKELSKRLAEIDERILNRLLPCYGLKNAKEYLGPRPKFLSPAVTIPWIFKLENNFFSGHLGRGLRTRLSTLFFLERKAAGGGILRELAIVKFTSHRELLKELEVTKAQKKQVLLICKRYEKKLTDYQKKLRAGNLDIDESIELYEKVKTFDQDFFEDISGLLTEKQSARLTQLILRFYIRAFGIGGLTWYANPKTQRAMDFQHISDTLDKLEAAYREDTKSIIEWHLGVVAETIGVSQKRLMKSLDIDVDLLRPHIDVILLRLKSTKKSTKE